MTTIDLITGILGAGKTTFIRKYAANLLAHYNPRASWVLKQSIFKPDTVFI